MTAAEEQPLLGAIPGDLEHGLKPESDDHSIEFEHGDPEDPRQWPGLFKWAMVLLLASMAFTVTFTCISVVPIANRIVRDLTPSDGSQQHSSTSSALLVTIWELGEAAGPLLIAPLSEVLGRYPVINGCNLLFITFTLVGALSQSTSLLIIARALTGLTVASNVLNPAIIGDMFESDHRGSAMSLLMLAPLVGGAIGPCISGGITEALGWRWVLLIAASLAATCELLFLTCFRETYKMKILRRKADRLGLKKPKKGANKLWPSITRPFEVLFGSAVLLGMSFFGSVAFSYYYVISISLPEILDRVYEFSPSEIGAAFLCFSVGSLFGVILCNTCLDRLYIALRQRCPNGTGKPEHRLPLAIIGAFTLPLAVTAYGWVAQTRLPVLLLLVSVSFVGFTLMLVIIPLSAYVVDAYKLYSASAMTGIIVIRCLMSTFFPLAIDPLVTSWGFGWGFTTLGAIALAFSPVPVCVFLWGEQWRQGSKFTRDEDYEPITN